MLTEQRWGGLEPIYSPEARVTKNLFATEKKKYYRMFLKKLPSKQYFSLLQNIQLLSVYKANSHTEGQFHKDRMKFLLHRLGTTKNDI